MALITRIVTVWFLKDSFMVIWMTIRTLIKTCLQLKLIFFGVAQFAFDGGMLANQWVAGHLVIKCASHIFLFKGVFSVTFEAIRAKRSLVLIAMAIGTQVKFQTCKLMSLKIINCRLCCSVAFFTVNLLMSTAERKISLKIVIIVIFSISPGIFIVAIVTGPVYEFTGMDIHMAIGAFSSQPQEGGGENIPGWLGFGIIQNILCFYEITSMAFIAIQVEVFTLKLITRF